MSVLLKKKKKLGTSNPSPFRRIIVVGNCNILKLKFLLQGHVKKQLVKKLLFGH